MENALTKSRLLLPLLLLLALPACKAVILFPEGDIAMQQRDIMVTTTLLMLIIIIPVMILTAIFAWRYRSSNTQAKYEPDWDHSTGLELVIWAVPLLIIICLGAVTWVGTHLLDPYRNLDRIAPGKQIAANTEPLEVQVVALDWKWLFFYPKYGIATLNEMAAPVNNPIKFYLTASSVMNAFYIPALAGQIYTMPGMQTQLSAVMNKPGDYTGFSSNYSGSGFSTMRFTFKALDEAAFAQWIENVKKSGKELTSSNYLKLEQPSEKEPVAYYAKFQSGLYQSILNMCVRPGSMCANEMASIDAKGGLDPTSAYNLLPNTTPYLPRQAIFSPEKTFVGTLCSISEMESMSNPLLLLNPSSPYPLTGAGMNISNFSTMGTM